jgi:predicted alpha/beta-hydrolase family hydrolase
MLHGGRERGREPVTDASASWRRSRWMMDHISDDLVRAGLSVWLLRYGVRGWNARAGAEPSPLADTRWALDQVRQVVGGVPVVLLGHSMGARAAVAVADQGNVVGVVALAPWLPAGEPAEALAGRHLAVAHGRSDRITSYRQSRRFCLDATGIAASAEFHDMGRAGHYMLRRIPDWNRFAVSRSVALSSRPPAPTTPPGPS